MVCPYIFIQQESLNLVCLCLTGISLHVVGHVTIGGSVCMEMLTRSGWRPTNEIEVKIWNIPYLWLKFIKELSFNVSSFNSYFCAWLAHETFI